MNADSKYFDEYYNWILDGEDPGTKPKRIVFNIINNFKNRRGLGLDTDIEADIWDDIIENLIKIVEDEK